MLSQVETIKLNSIIKNLEKDIDGLKKEILERDETIQVFKETLVKRFCLGFYLNIMRLCV